MSRAGNDSTSAPGDEALLAFFRTIAAHDRATVERALDATPRLAREPIRIAASRAEAETYFLDTIRHYIYGGDTALHIAAAASDLQTAQLLVALHAPVRARNRRGAEPLHYAADGNPDLVSGNPDAQRSIVDYLIAAGADPNALDSSGVAALHRAVRTRSSSAVRALLDNGADPTMMNKRGSTPLHLAVQNTGKSDSGTSAAKEQQRQIIELLQQRGARGTDTDAKGKTVFDAATSGWVRELLV